MMRVANTTQEQQGNLHRDKSRRVAGVGGYTPRLVKDDGSVILLLIIPFLTTIDMAHKSQPHSQGCWHFFIRTPPVSELSARL